MSDSTCRKKLCVVLTHMSHRQLLKALIINYLNSCSDIPPPPAANHFSD